MNPETASECVAILCDAFPKTKLRPAHIAAYISAIEDLPEQETREAIARLVATETFLPAIAEIRAAVVESTLGLPSEIEAWESVLRAVSVFGRYRLPHFPCDVVAETVAAFGWQEICNSENQGVLRAQFCKAYASKRDAAMARAQTGDLSRALFGAPERRKLGGGQ